MKGPLLLSVLIEPRNGARFRWSAMCGPGLTLEMNADLRVDLHSCIAKVNATSKPGLKDPAEGDAACA